MNATKPVLVRFLALAACAGLLAVPLLGFPGAGAPVRPGAEQLTVQETLGLVFVRGQEGAIWNVYRKASTDKDVKKALYRILKNKDLRYYEVPGSTGRWLTVYRRSALFVLGYVGDGKDAKIIETFLKDEFSGVLAPAESKEVTAALYAVGIMSHRGVPEATKTLARMTKVEYWRPVRFYWQSPKQILGLPPEYGSLEKVMAAYALSGQEDVAERGAAILATIPANRPMLHEDMEWRIAPRHLDDIRREFLETEKKPIDPELRRVLPRLFNGDLADPGPSNDPLD